ncbi:MAG: Crp/Fnr family transcriptional regulator [Alphaproteobacteria bacterium]|nr:Crp/Fnr family transcriptional regulator [Alphaproteobacteria bacterium]
MITIDERGVRRTLAQGEVVFEEGAEGDEMFVVLDGRVDIVKRINGETTLLAQVVKGDFFGEMGVIEVASARSATALAGQDGTRVLAIDQARFVYLVSHQPAFALAVMEALSRRLRATPEFYAA